MEGFHYYSVNIDGATVADPSTRTYFGSGWWNAGIEIPAPDQDFYSAKRSSSRPGQPAVVLLKVTGKWRRCFVYTPPDMTEERTNIPCCTCCTAGEKTRRLV